MLLRGQRPIWESPERKRIGLAPRVRPCLPPLRLLQLCAHNRCSGESGPHHRALEVSTTDGKWPNKLAQRGQPSSSPEHGCGGKGGQCLLFWPFAGPHSRQKPPGEWAGAAVLSSHCSAASASLRLFGRDFGLFPGEGPKTPKLANLASPQLRK